MRIPKLCDSIYNVDLLLSRRLNAFPALLILMIVLKIARLERLKNSCKLVGIYICLMPANALINHMMSNEKPAKHNTDSNSKISPQRKIIQTVKPEHFLSSPRF